MISDNKPQLVFAPAYDIIMHNRHLSPCEKLVLIEVCRWWPKPCHGSNAIIAHNTGLSIREVQYCLKSLSTGPTKRHVQGKPRRRAYIDRGYAHIHLEGKLYTSRVIRPLCLPGDALAPDSLGSKDFARR